MAALSVPDYAGVHGGLDPPAPLQITHRVLVQVAGENGGNPWTHASGGELEPALSCHKAEAKKKKTTE